MPRDLSHPFTVERDPTQPRCGRKERLSAETVREIRRLAAEGKHSQRAIAQLLGLNQTVVCRVVARRKYASIV